MVVSGTDLTGSGADVIACFDNHPLGPPLKASDPRPGMSADVGDGPIQDAKLVKLGLNNNPLAPLIDGVAASAGAGVMLFDVQNPWPEPGHLRGRAEGAAERDRGARPGGVPPSSSR